MDDASEGDSNETAVKLRKLNKRQRQRRREHAAMTNLTTITTDSIATTIDSIAATIDLIVTTVDSIATTIDLTTTTIAINYCLADRRLKTLGGVNCYSQSACVDSPHVIHRHSSNNCRCNDWSIFIGLLVGIDPTTCERVNLHEQELYGAEIGEVMSPSEGAPTTKLVVTPRPLRETQSASH